MTRIHVRGDGATLHEGECGRGEHVPEAALLRAHHAGQGEPVVQPSVQHGGHSGPLLGIQLCLPFRTSMVLSADLSLCHEEHV